MNTLIVYTLAGIAAAGSLGFARRLGKRGGLCFLVTVGLTAVLTTGLVLWDRPWMGRRLPAAGVGVVTGTVLAEMVRLRNRRGRAGAIARREPGLDGDLVESSAPWTFAPGLPAGNEPPGPARLGDTRTR
ncbi:MAG: hypothetical protein FJX77_11645 [Armatimonadetes bacterium]|nr:hypothetical protein [Armatimonadota bacterium]